MKIPFSKLPGRHERHYCRKLNNSIFPRPLRQTTDSDLLEVQRRDHEELIDFIQHLQGIVVRAAELPPNVDSETILLLKEQLDKAFETSAGLADDQSGNQFAIRKLTEVMMSAVRTSAGNDPLAHQELDQEDAARSAHYRLLEHAIVADLLHPQSLIEADELAPALLIEQPAGLEAALSLFDYDQLSEIIEQSKQIAVGHSDNDALHQCLAQMVEQLEKLKQARPK
jgi:hypothetical protein